MVSFRIEKNSSKYIKLIEYMYSDVLTGVKTSGGIASQFSITIGFHQGSTLGPYLFILVMNGLIQEKSLGVCFLHMI